MAKRKETHMSSSTPLVGPYFWTAKNERERMGLLLDPIMRITLIAIKEKGDLPIDEIFSLVSKICPHIVSKKDVCYAIFTLVHNKLIVRDHDVLQLGTLGEETLELFRDQVTIFQYELAFFDGTVDQPTT